MAFRYITPKRPNTASLTPKRIQRHSVTLPKISSLPRNPDPDAEESDTMFTASGRLMSVNKLHSTFSQMARYYEQKIKTLNKEKAKWRRLCLRKPPAPTLSVEHELNVADIAPVHTPCCTVSFESEQSRDKVDELRYLIQAQKQEIAFNMKSVTDFKDEITGIIEEETLDHFKRMQRKYEYTIGMLQTEKVNAVMSYEAMKAENEMLRAHMVANMADSDMLRIYKPETAETKTADVPRVRFGRFAVSAVSASAGELDQDDSKESSGDRKVKRKRKRSKSGKSRAKRKKKLLRSQSFCASSHHFYDKRRRTRVY